MTKLKSLSPHNGEVLAELDITTNDQIDEIVKKSHAAQKEWGAKTTKERADIVVKAYEKITENMDELVKLIHQEMGKTEAEALGEVKYYAGNIQNMANEVIEALESESTTANGATTTTYYDPLGVCASITPWNFPMGMPHTLMMPSLMAGNTVIFKPSEEVTLIGLKYAELLNQTLPQDVLQVVVGAGEQGKYLVESDVQLITFTGSQATGKHILASAGKDLKRVLLELGGKDPLILNDDADIEAAAKFAANNSFRNAGQVCVSTEQIFVLESQAEEFMTHLKKFAEGVKIGSMINSRQQDHVKKQVKEALDQGAKLEYGDPEADKLQPIILSNVSPKMNIMIDETFGPVACVHVVKSAAEAVEIANATEYALGGVVFGQDKEKARAIGRKLNAGMVGINRGVGGVKGSPWVGAGKSGYGYHGSEGGHRQFAQVRILTTFED
jgi:acyl-CoA reductase-like NAD-dependent aldehyde dehydrogenase